MTLFYIKGTTDTHKYTSVTRIIAMIYSSEESLADADCCGVIGKERKKTQALPYTANLTTLPSSITRLNPTHK
jgi:hypothetical protein